MFVVAVSFGLTLDWLLMPEEHVRLETELEHSFHHFARVQSSHYGIMPELLFLMFQVQFLLRSTLGDLYTLQ